MVEWCVHREGKGRGRTSARYRTTNVGLLYIVSNWAMVHYYFINHFSVPTDDYWTKYPLIDPSGNLRWNWWCRTGRRQCSHVDGLCINSITLWYTLLRLSITIQSDNKQCHYPFVTMTLFTFPPNHKEKARRDLLLSTFTLSFLFLRQVAITVIPEGAHRRRRWWSH